jgi:Leucine-rich repeat (LRR) protein
LQELYFQEEIRLTSLDISNCSQLKKIDCNNNLLTSLDISNCLQLTDLNCSDNLLIQLILPTNITSLKKLNLANNNFPEQDLSFLKETINLEELHLGNHDEEKIQQNIYNRFTGSLDYLNGMKKLR